LSSLGGATSVTNWINWAPSVVASPVPLFVHYAYMLHSLLTPANFPLDPDIAQKQVGIQNAIVHDLSASLTCPNRCSGNGQCNPLNYLNLGACACNAGWTGDDCSEKKATATLPAGTLCGFSMETMIATFTLLSLEIPCAGQSVRDSCPPGYLRQSYAWDAGTLFFHTTLANCYLPSASQQAPSGLICGMGDSTSPASSNAPCNGAQVAQGCPAGYQPYFKSGTSTSTDNALTCVLEDPSGIPLAGFFCGLGSTGGGGYNIPCAGYQPSQNACPPGYALQNLNHLYTDAASYKVNLNTCIWKGTQK